MGQEGELAVRKRRWPLRSCPLPPEVSVLPPGPCSSSLPHTPHLHLLLYSHIALFPIPPLLPQHQVLGVAGMLASLHLISLQSRTSLLSPPPGSIPWYASTPVNLLSACTHNYSGNYHSGLEWYTYVAVAASTRFWNVSPLTTDSAQLFLYVGA